MLYIDINKDIIPYQFELSLKRETFQFDVRYNEFGDFFTFDLYKNRVPVLFGEKLVYGMNTFESYQHLDIPKVYIRPLDPADKVNRITYENLGDKVFVTVSDKDVY